MNVLIAKIIKDRLSDLPYFDKTAGLVQTITKEDSEDSGAKNRILRFPVEVDLAEEKNLIPMIPDSDIKGMFYVEDGGVKAEGTNDYTSDLTLVCWLNPKKISNNVEAVSASAISDIVSVLCKGYFNDAPASRARFTAVSIPVRDAAIFSKYNYSEVQTQYLMPPFDFFAIKFKVSYRLTKSCLTELTPAEPC